MLARLRRLVDAVRQLAPVRAWLAFLDRRGPLLAQGLAFKSLFAIFAAIWLLFAGFGVWLSGSSHLVTAIVETINSAVPGLIDTGEGGAVELDRLLSISAFGWTGAIAAVVLLWTATGWLSSLRRAVRAVADRSTPAGNPLLLRALDLGLGLGFGIAFIASALLTVFSTSFVRIVLREWWQIDGDAVPIATSVTGFLVASVIDALALWGVYRGLALLRTTRGRMLQAVVGGAIALGVLKVLGTLIVGGTTSNPLLASFATMIGLLLYFNVASYVLLLPAAWIGLDERGAPDDAETGTSQPGEQQARVRLTKDSA